MPHSCTGAVLLPAASISGVVPLEAERSLQCDHIEERGEHLFGLACKRDPEGIVAKRKFDPYLPNAKWYKIRNRYYPLWTGREKRFERERSTDPELALPEHVRSGK